MGVLKRNGFIPTEISKSCVENFLFENKVLESALLLPSDIYCSVEFKSILKEFIRNRYELSDSLVGYLWLINNGYSASDVYVKNFLNNMISWRNDVLREGGCFELPNKGVTAFEIYEYSNLFPFDMSFYSIYTTKDIKLILDTFGEFFIDDRILSLLKDYSFEDESFFMKSIAEETVEDYFDMRCVMYDDYKPSELTDYDIYLLSCNSGLHYYDNLISFGCIFISSSEISNFLKGSDIKSVYLLIDFLSELLLHVGRRVSTVSIPRVISKNSPLWSLYERSHNFNSEDEFAIVSSYFRFDVADKFDLDYFHKDELYKIDELNNNIKNLLKEMVGNKYE